VPSKDTYHEERPETNEWLASEPSLPTFSTPPGSYLDSLKDRAASRTKTTNAAAVQALAARMGVDAEELAARIPEDTLRRLKYPYIEQVDPKTGLLMFKHDIGIVADQRTPLRATDRAYDAIEKGKSGRGAGVPQPRVNGRFSK
jgi:hypothetical protein